MVLTRKAGAGRSVEISLAILERLIQRGSTAFLTLLIAFIGGPNELGRYASAIVVLTLYQAAMEVPFRQVGVTMWRFADGGHQLRLMSFVLGFGGVPLIGGLILLIGLPNPEKFLDTLPIALVPIFSAVSLRYLTAAQRGGKSGWSSIARAQGIATAISLTIVVPLIFVNAVLAASVQVVMTEAIFALTIRRYSSHESLAALPSEREEKLLQRYVGPTVLANVLGWSQTQLERIVLVFFAPVSLIGSYSLSVALSRTVSDAVTLGSVNAVRAHISLASSDQKVAQMLGGANRTQKITLALQGALSALAVLVLPYVLSQHWHQALLLAPLFGASAATLSVSWVISAYLIETGRSKALLPAQILGVLFSCAVGYLLYKNILLGALASIVRDLLSTSLRVALVRRVITRAQIASLFGWGLGSILVSVTLYLIGSITIGM